MVNFYRYVRHGLKARATRKKVKRISTGHPSHVVTVTATDGSVHEFEMSLYPDYQAVPPQSVELQFTPRQGTTSSLSIPDAPYLLVYGGFSRTGKEITLLGDDINNIIFDADTYILTLRNDG